jgi:hypothetical protein
MSSLYRRPDPDLVEQLAETDGASIDPTRSTTKRERFEAKFNKRWNRVKGDINDLLSSSESYYHPQNSMSESRQIADFRDWLDDELEETVIEPVRQREARRGEHWTASRVREFYEHGLERADVELRKVGYDIPTAVTGTDILRQDPGGLHEEQLADEYLAVYQELEDIANRTEQEISREYREAAMAGLALGVTTKALKDRIDSSRAGKNATRQLAHTRAGVQVINAASLERYHEAGVEEVGAVIEVDVEVEEMDDLENDFVTAGDPLVCSQCRTYAAGGPYLVEDIRAGRAPMPGRDTHPGCRCYLTPSQQ